MCCLHFDFLIEALTPVAGSCHQEYIGSVSTGVGHELTHFIDRLIVVDWSHIIVQNVFVVCFDKRNLHRDEIKINYKNAYLLSRAIFLKIMSYH